MTCKLTRKSHLRGVIASFIAMLIVLASLAAPAQMTKASQPSGKPNDVFAPPGSAASLQALPHRLVPRTNNVERSVSRLRMKRRGAVPMDENPSLFLPAVTYDSGGFFTFSLAVADLNRDGTPDAILSSVYCYPISVSCVSVLVGRGDGTFEAAVDYPSGGLSAWFVAAADVNGDGKPDIVVANTYSDSVGVLLGNGDGTLQPALAYNSGGIAPVWVAVADVNGDGKPDVAVANANSDTVGVLLGNGDGTFKPVVTYSSGAPGPDSVTVADVNGDGKPDLIVPGYLGSGPPWGAIGVLLGNGDGTFQAAVSYGWGQGWHDVAVADVNGDGKPDLITFGCVLFGNGDGTFQAPVQLQSYGLEITVADVNDDGKLDLLWAKGNLSSVDVQLGNGNGTFQDPLAFGSGGYYAHQVAVADVNGDGKPDLLVANRCTTSDCPNPGHGLLGVLLNNTLPHSPTTTTLTSSVNPSVFGEAVTFTVQVSSDAGTPAGAVKFFDGISFLGSATLANGTTSISVSSLASGAHSITGVYQGSPIFDPSTSVPLNQVVNVAISATSLVSSPNPVGINKTVRYTATVAGQYGGAAAGIVTFRDGGSTIATVPLGNNQAAYSTSYKSIGVHSITASYSGDANNTRSTSTALKEYIAGISKTVVTTSGSPTFVGQTVTFTATVTSTNGTIPDGELMTFYDGTTVLGSVPLASGIAAYATSSLSAKTHYIKATYAGDTTFLPSAGRVMQAVIKYLTTTALISIPNPSVYSQPVTFTATVTPSGPYPLTGKVWFKDGPTGIGAVTLNSGVATLSKKWLAVGTHSITAQYLGDAASGKSTSSVLSQVVNP